MNDRTVVVSLHDVSPHTFADCQKIISRLEEVGVDRCSLLVVPDHHHRGHFLKFPDFCDWLKEVVSRGHEAVIHGYHHLRERRADESLAAQLTTRFYTADEGEFYDIDRFRALELVAKAKDEFESIGLNPCGFIAPAWLLSADAEIALRDLGIRHTNRLGQILDLETGTRIESQSLCWSVRSAWRRVASLAWNAFLFRRLHSIPLLRISIHPVDYHHPAIWRQILCLTARALRTRSPLTYEGAVTGKEMPGARAPLSAKRLPI